MNEQSIIRQAMSVIGKRKSRKKAVSSRRNGQKGGRPRTNRAEVQQKALEASK